MDDSLTLDEALEDLVSAEDFLDYFDVSYDPSIVQVNRLHILQRFHDYLGRYVAPDADEDTRRHQYQAWLTQAYQDFVASDSLTEKVFRVFHNTKTPDGGMSSFVSLDRVFQ